MRQRKHERHPRRQRGQFMTPPELAAEIVGRLDLPERARGGGLRILEPSCGQGAFLAALAGCSGGLRRARSTAALPMTIIGIEVDPACAAASRSLAGRLQREAPACRIDVAQADFFELFLQRERAESEESRSNPLAEPFDLIIGNPPFGGTFRPELEDELDRVLGERFGRKIKKETYAFFIVAGAELLRPGGRLVFVCSDSLLTIATMTGLRNFLMATGSVRLHRLEEFSAETTYPMLIIDYQRGPAAADVLRFGERLPVARIQTTANLSWGITADLAGLFAGPKLGDYFVATSGMTTGRNEYFVREIQPDGAIIEPYKFTFHDVPVTVAYERERARLNRLPSTRERALMLAEARGETERRVTITPRPQPLRIVLPHPAYRPYNKANGRIVFAPPTHVIYWENDGDAVLTYKRTGNWYLRGVGGQPYFGRSGLTWQLVASRFVSSFLPPGYILDSGAPCAFPREGVDPDEIHFVLGWLLAPAANRILKTAINHTRNIQSKDFERMPYPWWIAPEEKAEIIRQVRGLIAEGQAGRVWTFADREVEELGARFEPPATSRNAPPGSRRRRTPLGASGRAELRTLRRPAPGLRRRRGLN